tara:strand:+ start:67 stop:495 length:429 start_codon:yes stop_codon:yes gene_type:complete
MATRANIKLKNLGEEPLYLYRHWDGFLEETGFDLLKTLLDCNRLVKGIVPMKDFRNTLISKKDYKAVNEEMGGTEFFYEFTFMKNGVHFWSCEVDWMSDALGKFLEGTYITKDDNLENIVEHLHSKEMKEAIANHHQARIAV